MIWTNSDGLTVTTEQLLQDFAALDANNNVEADDLFRRFGPGHPILTSNPTIVVIHTIQERLLQYEHILHEIYTADPAKYQQIHKGQIYYLAGWLAYTLKDFEKAIFYEDAALSEDIRAVARTANPNSWQTSPAADFLLLNTASPGSASITAVADLVRNLDQYITAFNGRTGARLTVELFKTNFLASSISNASFRSIISGFFVFIMEYSERTYLIRLRSIGGGSIQSFLVHLFSGCLVFESLLKTQYGGATGTLSTYLNHTTAKSNLEISGTGYPRPLYLRDMPRGGYTMQSIISLLPTWRTEKYIEKIIAISYGIRNTAGHDLSWLDPFNEVIYQELYDSIIDAILWFIWKTKI